MENIKKDRNLTNKDRDTISGNTASARFSGLPCVFVSVGIAKVTFLILVTCQSSTGCEIKETLFIRDLNPALSV